MPIPGHLKVANLRVDHGFGAQVMLKIRVFSNEPGTSSGEGSQLVPVSHQTSFSHVCMDKDQRMDLLRNKGKLWGDDEIRFHLGSLD